MNGPAAKPWIEVVRKRDGVWRIYASVHRRPLRVWVLGRWIIGRPW